MTVVIRTENLVKTYDKVRALDGLNLHIEEGEFFGLLGPNGAGKTTLISVLSTMLPATNGYAEVASYDVARSPHEVRNRIGVVFQDPSLDEELTGLENLVFHAKLYKVPRATRNQRIEELLKIVELAERQHDLVKTYSGGMRRRLELARGLIHHPHILFLDEPTLGLDPQTRAHIWDYIRRLNAEERVTMVLTTHYMDEADSLCNRIAIIDKGRIVAQGTPSELKSQIGGDVVYLHVNGGADRVVPALQRLESVRGVKTANGQLQLEVSDGAHAIPRILDIARQEGISVASVQMSRPTLNDVFIKHTGRAIREESMDAQDRMSYYMRRHRR